MTKHSHYHKDVSVYKSIDIYRLLMLFEQNDPAMQHIVKKALVAGKRGSKDFRKDVQEIADTAVRRLAMLDEDQEATGLVLPGDHPQPVYEDVKRPAKVAEPDADGWIVWDGAACPVGEEQAVELRFKDGSTFRSYKAGLWKWGNFGGDFSITHYRLVKDEPQWPMVSEPGDHSKIKAAYKPGMEWTAAFEGTPFLGGWNGNNVFPPSWLKNYRYSIRPAQGAQA